VALFAIVIGIALLLIGFGLLVFTVRWMQERSSATRTAPAVTGANAAAV
jgi:hypothetical protein